jgi:hypothetical protein
MNRSGIPLAVVITPVALVSLAIGCTSLLGDFSLATSVPDSGSTGDAPNDGPHDARLDGGDDAGDAGGNEASGDDSGDDSTVAAPCANNAPAAQQFTSKMYGCAGVVIWDNRATLCNSPCVTCSATQWVNGHGSAAPTHDYWTDDNLGYNGGGAGLCEAILDGGNLCGAGGDAGDFAPFRVCLPANPFPDGGFTSLKDPEGNVCNWSDCGFGTVSPDEFFGGCANDFTAGTLCCCP